MLFKLALVLPINILVCYALIRYRLVIKGMGSLDSLFSSLTDEGFGDDTPEEGVAQRKKCKALKVHTKVL